MPKWVCKNGAAKRATRIGDAAKMNFARRMAAIIDSPIRQVNSLHH